MRSRSPNGVLIASNAIDPTTVSDMRAGRLVQGIGSGAMRCVQIEEFGGPEVLEVADLPKPEPGDGEVLIEVSRAGINFADTHQRENSYLARYEVPLVLGGEVAGTTPDGRRVVALVGSAVTPSTPWRTRPRSSRSRTAWTTPRRSR